MWCYVHAGRHNPDTVAAEVTQNVKHIEREGERQGESERERDRNRMHQLLVYVERYVMLYVYTYIHICMYVCVETEKLPQLYICVSVTCMYYAYSFADIQL